MFSEDQYNHSSSDYRKTAHEGDFDFKKVDKKQPSLSHEEVIDRLKKEREELLKKASSSKYAADFFGKKKR